MKPTFNEPDGFVQFVVECEKSGERGALSRTAAFFGVERSTVTRAAKAHRWVARYRGEVAPIVEARTCERAADAVMDWREAQIQTGEVLRRKGLEALAVLQPNSVREAHDLVRLGSDLIAKAHDTGTRTVSVEHTLRQQLLPSVPPPAPERPRLQITVADNIDDLLSDEEKQSVLDDLENNE